MKYKDWLKEWLEHYVEPTTKARTFDRYSDIVSQHLIPKLGDYELTEIIPAYYNVMLRNYCSQAI